MSRPESGELKVTGRHKIGCLLIQQVSNQPRDVTLHSSAASCWRCVLKNIRCFAIFAASLYDEPQPRQRPSLSFFRRQDPTPSLLSIFEMTLTKHRHVSTSAVVKGLPTGMAFNNGDRLSHDKVGLMQPTPKDTPFDEMRQKMKETGYVFIKGLIPRDDVLRVREK